MAFIPPPPSAYKHLQEMSLEELNNTAYQLKLDIIRLYGKLQMPIPVGFKLGVKPHPNVDTPNVFMRSYRVDGTIGREKYNCERQIKDCKELIVNIEERIGKMPKL